MKQHSLTAVQSFRRSMLRSSSLRCCITQQLSYSAALCTSRRGQISGFSHKYPFTRVEQKMSGEDMAGLMTDLPGTPAKEEEETEALTEVCPTVVNILEEEAALLSKKHSLPKQRSNAALLTEGERRTLVQLIYDAHYKTNGETVPDPAMMYEASLELRWIEEWALQPDAPRRVGDALAATPQEAARRLVKRSVLERAEYHKPLSYIIGSQPFYGCDMICRSPLLCPRPETELWTHWYVSQHLSKADSGEQRTIQVLDVCCGTGCIGVSIAKHVPHAVVTALDIMPEAVATSTENAARNGIPKERYRAMQSDMFSCFGAGGGAAACDQQPVEEEGKEAYTLLLPSRPKVEIADAHRHTFDVIVSNPPYILPEEYVTLPRDVAQWESKLALVGDAYREHRQYLYFQELCECGASLLKPRRQRDAVLRHRPNMVVEIGQQAEMVASLMERSGLFDDVEIHLDFAQRPRWVTASSTH